MGAPEHLYFIGRDGKMIGSGEIRAFFLISE
jgi:hypothetical protein